MTGENNGAVASKNSQAVQKKKKRTASPLQHLDQRGPPPMAPPRRKGVKKRDPEKRGEDVPENLHPLPKETEENANASSQVKKEQGGGPGQHSLCRRRGKVNLLMKGALLPTQKEKNIGRGIQYPG